MARKGKPEKATDHTRLFPSTRRRLKAEAALRPNTTSLAQLIDEKSKLKPCEHCIK